jgi:hypothetical protein
MENLRFEQEEGRPLRTQVFESKTETTMISLKEIRYNQLRFI